MLQTLFIPPLTPSFPSLQVWQVPRGGLSSNCTDDGCEKGRLLEKDEITLILECQTGLCLKRAMDLKGKKIKKTKNKCKLEAPPHTVIEKLMLDFQENWSCVCWITGSYRWSLKNFEQCQRETWSTRREILLHLLTLGQLCWIDDVFYFWWCILFPCYVLFLKSHK